MEGRMKYLIIVGDGMADDRLPTYLRPPEWGLRSGRPKSFGTACPCPLGQVFQPEAEDIRGK
jgi:hypothetical protein